MKTYKDYLLESADSTRHVAPVELTVGDIRIHPGDVYYTKNGHLHREDGPAIEGVGGDTEWCKNGQLHRDDGPAVEKPDGSKFWYKDGDRHREDGPAWIVPGLPPAWFMFGERITKVRNVFSEDFKWKLLRLNPESITVINQPTKEMQEYVIKHRPDLIGEIDDLDPELKAKYQHEVGLGQVDL